METLVTKEHVCLRMSRGDKDFAELLNIVKRVPGSKYHSSTNFWSFPRKGDDHPKGFTNDKELLQHLNLELEKARFSQGVKYEEAALPELEVHIPLKRPMYPFQRAGVAYAIQMKRCLIGDQQGLGKTIQALAAVIAQDAFPCLIITKSALVLNWEKEVKEWTSKRSFIFKDSVKNSWNVLFQVGAAEIGIVNYESLEKYFVARIEKPADHPLKVAHIKFKETIACFKSIIIDESHYVKDGTRKRTKICLGMTRQRQNVYLLSGTPVLNDAAELYPQICMLNLETKFGSFAAFKRQFAGKANKNWKMLNAMMKKFGYYRRTKAEVLTDLPEKSRQVILCDIDNREEYDLAQFQFQRFLEERLRLTAGQIDKKLRAEALVKMGELKKLSAKGKIQNVIEWGETLIEDKQKFVLYSFHKEVGLNLKRAFPNAVSILGDDDQDQIQRNKEQFMTSPAVPAIVCSISKAAEGHTLTAASNLGMVELPWHFGKAEQCEDRIHRIGQKDGATIAYFLGRDTVDEKIYELIMTKKDMHTQVTGTAEEADDLVIDSLINLFADRKKAAAAAPVQAAFSSDDF